MSFNEGVRALPGGRRAVGQIWTSSEGWFWASGGVSLLGYLALFVTMHLNSLRWAPGQVLEPLSAYWHWFYRTIFTEERVLADRRSALAALHPLLMIGALALIAAGYLATLYIVRALPAERQPRLRTWLLTTLAFSLPLLILPNLLTSDIYSYISFGRITTLHAGNPFVDPPAKYPYDMYLRWVNWDDVPSVYGPTWIYLSILVTVVVESIHSHVITYVLAYKLLALGLHLCNGVLIWTILWHWRPEQRSWGTALYLLNPLALIEFAGNAHNDVLMIAFILAGILMHLRGHWIGTVVAFTLAVLTKWIALPLLPLYALLLLRSQWSFGRRLSYVGASLGIFAAVSAGLYLPYWEGPATLKVLLDAPPQKLFINSVGEVVVHEVQYGMYLLGRWPHPAFGEFSPLVMRAPRAREIEDASGQDWRVRQRTRLQRYNSTQLRERIAVQAQRRTLQNVVRFTGLGLVMLACIAGALVARSLRTMLLAGAWIFFVYTTIGAVWTWPWYATWFVALAALLDWQVTGRAALLLSLLSLLFYPLFPDLPEPALAERFRALIVFGPPLAFAALHLTQLLRSYFQREWTLRDLARYD